jgi:MoxR-like ATPase
VIIPEVDINLQLISITYTSSITIQENPLSQIVENIKTEIAKVLVGQDKMVEGLLAGLLCRGHILLEGVPGLAKTTAVKSML